jgi:hypothetical protein
VKILGIDPGTAESAYVSLEGGVPREVGYPEKRRALGATEALYGSSIGN